MEDSEIIDLYFARAERAIAETADKYGTLLGGIARRILPSPEDAEEIVGDTYLRTWNAIPPTRPRVLRHFLTRITRNLSFDRLAYYSAARRGGETVVLLDELESCLPDWRGSAEDAVMERELTETLNRFLGELDKTECRVFLMRYYYAMGRGEIAARLGLSEGRVKYLLAHARRTLQAKLCQEGITG